MEESWNVDVGFKEVSWWNDLDLDLNLKVGYIGSIKIENIQIQV